MATSSYFKIAAVKVHPTNSNIVVAATRNGVYKTVDGGERAGVNFYKR